MENVQKDPRAVSHVLFMHLDHACDPLRIPLTLVAIASAFFAEFTCVLMGTHNLGHLRNQVGFSPFFCGFLTTL